MLTVQQIKNTITDYFKDKPVKKVYLFGSYARGEAKEDSDVDLLVELDYEKRIGLEFVRWVLFLQDKFARKVDLVPDQTLYPAVRKGADDDKILMLSQ
ncbi:MAG: hypothetical protein BGO69_00265 [Bacteroidetes bacterium 46-16]|nr:MAG: hypothetical protein BGO69_00265 [Bacteroidetes bacterium 46-16]